MTTYYFSCATCQRVAGRSAPQLQCPYCGSLIGKSSPEPPAIPKGMIRPRGRYAARKAFFPVHDR